MLAPSVLWDGTSVGAEHAAAHPSSEGVPVEAGRAHNAGMRRSVARDVRAAVADAAGSAADPLALQREVAAQVGRVVPFDRWCALITDPATGEVTGGYHDEGLPFEHLPRLAELEARRDGSDATTLRDLVTGAATAVSLRQATAGDPHTNARYRDVLLPSGVGDEVRWLMRGADGRAWGALILFRATDLPDFTSVELSELRRQARVVADGMRRAMVLDNAQGAAEHGAEEGPGLVLCRVSDTVVVDLASASAQRWLEQIDDGSADGLPYAVAAQVYLARRDPAGAVRRVRLRSRAGRWLTAHVERLGESSVSVILEPTRTEEMAELLSDAFFLTPRERQVAELAARGSTNREIGAAVFLSPYTVQDHLKSVYAKTGARNRSELSSVLSGGSPGAQGVQRARTP